nr:hypothetical protein [Clostridia bacterium]
MGGIVTNNLSFSYGKNQVLKDVSFTAYEGEITYLAGLNGAGKTTWIKLCSDLLIPDKGEILLGFSPQKAMKHLYSVVFDFPPVYPQLTGYDNLYVLYGVDSKLKNFKKIQDAMGLSDYLLRKKARDYSLGQHHRLAIMGALLRDPKYLVLDEPDIGIDPEGWSAVKECLLMMKNEGAAIVITGQHMDEMCELADRVVILHNRTIVYDNRKEQLIADHPNSTYTDIIMSYMR